MTGKHINDWIAQTQMREEEEEEAGKGVTRDRVAGSIMGGRRYCDSVRTFLYQSQGHAARWLATGGQLKNKLSSN